MPLFVHVFAVLAIHIIFVAKMQELSVNDLHKTFDRVVHVRMYRISSNLSDTSNYPDTLLGNFRCSNTTDTPVL